ncbi:hypothetical protein GJ496_004760 [Pomphorhynchus laevis]|nr:hypothetical protein GJ496_004760 [Pomphorhynchus laevis]
MSFQVFTPQGNIHRLYLSIIEDLTENIRDSFLDEGLDESHLNEFAHVWQVKLDSTKALENLNGAEHPRHNVAMPITTMIAPSHNAVLANRIEESRYAYQQKLAQNLSNMNSKSEPLDFSKCTGFNLGKIRFQGHEQQSASSLLTMRERLQNAASVRPQGNNATISQSVNILNRHQLRNNLIPGGTLHDSNTSNLLNLRRSAHELLKNQTSNQVLYKIISK